MRKSGPPKGPVQGKTGIHKNDNLDDQPSTKGQPASRKRHPFSIISNSEENQISGSNTKRIKEIGFEQAKNIIKKKTTAQNKIKKKTKAQKVEQMQSSAFFVQGASPETNNRVMKTIKQHSGLSEILTPSRFNNGEISPGGAPKWVETSTPRKRIFDRTNDFPAVRDFADGRSKVVRGLFFSERLQNDTREKSLSLPEELASKPTVEQVFGPVLITQDGINNVPSRNSLKKESQVMGGVKANDVAVKLLGEKLPTNFQNSHQIGIAVGAGDVDTQVPENIYVGTDKTNWTKKHFELEFPQLLGKNPERELGLLSVAELIKDTTFAKRELLMYDFLRPNGNSTHGSLEFDTLRLETECVLPSRAFGLMMDKLMEIDDEAIEEEGLNPLSPNR